ncbi:MAG: hypothetical protein KA217_08435 [Gammaproteobacteria bacterium]|nr:hypothetical protein [Gammaproteobacteria bacterium]
MRHPGPDDPLHLTLRASRGLALFLVALHGGAAACVGLASLPSGVRWAGLLALAANLGRHLRRHALRRGAGAVLGITAGSSGDWTLVLANGRGLTARLLPGSLAHPWLVVLHLREGTGRRRWSVPVAPDAVDEDTHRRLRIRLGLRSDGGHSGQTPDVRAAGTE